MYIVEGNIGAGKSTFLKLVAQQAPHISVALEPVHNWQSNVSGQSLLANFYQNPKRWAYTLETFAMFCRVKEHLREQENSNTYRLIERSIYSGHYCFALNGYEQGFMNELEWQMYNDWFNALVPGKCKPPLGFIYLRTDPALAYKRIKKRNRLAEKKINLGYLKQIHQHHDDFLVNHKGVFAELIKVPVLILDANQEFEQEPVIFKQHLETIENFMSTTEIPGKPAQSSFLRNT